MDRGILERLDENVTARSPGMKYKHYSPKADVILLRGDALPYAQYLADHIQDGEYAMCFEEDIQYIDVPLIAYGGRNDYRRQANQLFDILRELDQLEATRIYVHAPEPQGIGLAVYNRLIRAAGFQVVDLPADGREAD